MTAEAAGILADELTRLRDHLRAVEAERDGILRVLDDHVRETGKIVGERDRYREELASERRFRLRLAGERDAARSELSRLLRFFRPAGGSWRATVAAGALGRLAANGGVELPDAIGQEGRDAGTAAGGAEAATGGPLSPADGEEGADGAAEAPPGTPGGQT